MQIEFKNITKRFGSVVALDNFSLSIPEGNLMCLLGPSGGGKSTLLSLLTGLLTPDEGEIYIGEKLASTPNKIIIAPRERRIGMVFQSLALWPHMTVRKNLEFVLKGHCPKPERNERVNSMLNLMDIAHYADTYPSLLSGGESQRVALARALVLKPKIFLLDEPLSNLDPLLARRLLSLIKEYHQQFGTTTIYVTHNQSEALNLADLVAVVQNGRLIQSSPPETVYQQPANKFVASFIGEGNLIEGELISSNLLRTPFGEIPCTANPAISGKKVLALFRPENLYENAQGSIRGKIIKTEFKGEKWLATINTEQNLMLYINFPDSPAINRHIVLAINNPVWVIPPA